MENSTSNQRLDGNKNANLKANASLKAHDESSHEERFNHARSLHFKGEFDQAEAIYLQLQTLESWPQLSELLGILYLQNERYQDAIAQFNLCDEADYTNADLLFNYGKCYTALGGVEQALGLYQRALVIDPQHSNSIYNLANLYKGIEDYKHAKEYFEKDYQMHPKVDTCCALGEILEREKNLEGALEFYHRGLELDPDNPLPKLRISIALQKRNTSAPEINFSEFNTIFRFCREILAEFPDNAICYALIGDMYLLLGNMHESMAHMRTSIALDASFATSHTALGCQLLMTGQFEEGFKEFYWHSQVTEYDTGTVARSVAGSTKKEWSGEVYSGMRLLVTSEQGIGDQILHFQCLPGLIAKGVRLIISVNYKLVPLFVRSFPELDVYPDCYPIPDAVEDQVDFQTSVLGLTQFLVRSIDDVVGVPRYLQPCEEKTSQIAQRYLKYEKTLKVGISWSSNSTSTGRSKTIALEWWRDLLALEGVQFISLQYGGVGEEVAAVNHQYGTDLIIDREINITEDQDAFAALLNNLDLVITISNATAHLCGALGVNTWTILSPAPLWHWFYGLDHSVWYPSMCLVRRAPHEHWKDALNRIGAALPRLVSNKAAGIDLFDGVPEGLAPKNSER